MGELNGKVAIITGAGRLRSIGFETAMALARMGAQVVVTGTGRDPDTFPPDEKKLGWRDVESTAERVRESGGKALPLVADVTREDHVDRMVTRTLEAFGRVDILVNNAAMPIGRDRVPTAELDPDVFQKVMDVKVRGTYLCSRAVIPSLIRQGEGGKIVNVASSAGKRGSAEALAYCAANFAQVGMTQSLAQELGPYRVNVNCICPAAVDTSRMDRFGRGEQWKKMGASHPIGRTGTREEVGAFIAYLCSGAASWIHGQSINIDGGMVMEH
jgi:NAD(P)-dependent dehydrogenase (short-subunit alcohol dehydrogenase family)